MKDKAFNHRVAKKGLDYRPLPNCLPNPWRLRPEREARSKWLRRPWSYRGGHDATARNPGHRPRPHESIHQGAGVGGVSAPCRVSTI